MLRKSQKVVSSDPSVDISSTVQYNDYSFFCSKTNPSSTIQLWKAYNTNHRRSKHCNEQQKRKKERKDKKKKKKMNLCQSLLGGNI